MTLLVPRLSDAVAAYHALGYQDAPFSTDSAAAIALTDPMLTACPNHTILMSQEPYQTLTFIEWDGDVPTPFAAPGWAAMEVLVKDLDALFAELPPAFSLLNPPAALSFSEHIRAMQVAGPAGELIYFTEVSGEVPGFTLPTATQQVNQCFVMINAVTAIQTSIDFYARLLGCAAPSAMPARVSILSRSNGLDEDHRHAIAPIALSPGQLFELDQWIERPVAVGQHPPCGWHSLSIRRNTPPPEGMATAPAVITEHLRCYNIATPDGERILWLCPHH